MIQVKIIDALKRKLILNKLINTPTITLSLHLPGFALRAMPGTAGNRWAAAHNAFLKCELVPLDSETPKFFIKNARQNNYLIYLRNIILFYWIKFLIWMAFVYINHNFCYHIVRFHSFCTCTGKISALYCNIK